MRGMRFYRGFHSGEDGFALVTVIGILLIMTLLIVVMVSNIQSELNGVRRQRDVTTALDAADGGLDQMVFQIQQTTGTTANWDLYVTNYSTSSGNWWPSATGAVIGKGTYKAHIDCDKNDCANGDPNRRLVTLVGQFPKATGQSATVQATIERQAPAALDFAMFAQKGIDIHHHSSSWVSPTVVTPQVHSNGYIKIDWSSLFHVDTLEAATSIDLGAGGGSTPGGGIPSGGYNWPYWISGSDATNPSRCYPPKVFPPPDYPSASWNSPDASHVCPATPVYSPHALTQGNVLANSVTIEKTAD